jgi:hypothetical protein
MKRLPDSDRKKRFMKTGLPIMLGIAWAPIIWILVIPLLTPVLFTLTGSWPVTQGGVLVIVLFVTYLLLKVFMRLGTKFYSNNQ